MFWKNIKPFFSNKVSISEITLVEGEKIISDDLDIANTFNCFFENAAKMRDIPQNDDQTIIQSDTLDSIGEIIRRFSNHPSILSITKTIKKSTFNLNLSDFDEIRKEVLNLNTKVSCPSGSVSSSILKDNVDISSENLLNIINIGILNSKFDDGMKSADITPIFKRDEPIYKENYRPISCLSAGSKKFERILHRQIASYIDTYLSPYLCGYRKGYSAQYAVMTLLEKWRISLDNHGYGGAILMDLSKAFDTLNHQLLIAKLHAYGFTHGTLTLLYSYLSNRWQRTKVNNSYSTWAEILQGVPQGSILGPLLFNIYINDLLLLDIKSDLCNFADDNTLHVSDLSLSTVVDKLESSAKSVINWFEYNYMKLNQSKCKILISGNKEEVIIATVGETKIIESHKVKLLGIYIDRELKLNDHVNSSYKKAGKKLNALIRLCNILPFHRRRLLMKSFIESQFGYSPLIGLFYSRTLNTKINLLHYRALKYVYQDETSTFEELLTKDKSVTIHHRNIQFLAIELYKVKNGDAPYLLKNIFTARDIPEDSVVANLRSQTDFYNFPTEIKNISSLSSFKDKVRKWIPVNCLCRLCQNYIDGVGFI